MSFFIPRCISDCFCGRAKNVVPEAVAAPVTQAAEAVEDSEKDKMHSAVHDVLYLLSDSQQTAPLPVPALIRIITDYCYDPYYSTLNALLQTADSRQSIERDAALVVTQIQMYIDISITNLDQLRVFIDLHPNVRNDWRIEPALNSPGYRAMQELGEHVSSRESIDLTRVECTSDEQVKILRFTLKPEQLTPTNKLLLEIMNHLFYYRNEQMEFFGELFAEHTTPLPAAGVAPELITKRVLCGNPMNSVILKNLENWLCNEVFSIGRDSIRDSILDWHKAHIPRAWTAPEIEGAKETVTAMRQDNKSDDAILAALKERRDIWALPHVPPEEAIQTYRETLYLEREIIVDMNASAMKFKPETIRYMLEQMSQPAAVQQGAKAAAVASKNGFAA